MLKKSRLLIRPTLAATSPARPEPAKTASLPKDAPYPMQGRNSEADPRFTFHASRFTVPGSDARTKLAGFFSIVLKIPTAFDRLQQRHFVGILDIHPDRNAIGDTRDPGPERFQLVR